MEQPIFTLIIPCYNEEGAIIPTIEQLRDQLAEMAHYEIIIVNDGSRDNTSAQLDKACQEDESLKVITHERNQGYGASLKTGIRHAKSDLIVITDADGSYPNNRIPELVAMAEHADMVVGARTAEDVTYSFIRKIPKLFLVAYASWLVKRPIPDLNSGLRVFRKSIAERFFNIFPDGFSFTTTITMAMLTNRYHVLYHPVEYYQRIGKSKIRPIRDTLNFIQLIVRTGVYFAPLRVFAPIIFLFSTAFFASLTYDIFWLEDLTEKTILLLMFSMNTLLFSLLADMIDKRV